MSSEMQQIEELEVKADARVDLAVERTELAWERTHLAWIRTTFAMMTAGIALDKGLEFIHQQRLLTNKALAENGHIIGIMITSFGVVLLLLETIQFVRRSRQLANLRKATYSFFSTNFILAALVIITGIALIYLMIATGSN
jgi:putative membrane protein